MQMPDGYETVMSEGGDNLSGARNNASIWRAPLFVTRQS